MIKRISDKYNYFKPANGMFDEGCHSIYLKNIDTSLRRIADSLENGDKVKQLEAALGKADCEIKRLMTELQATKDDLAKVESKAAHFEDELNRAKEGV